MAEPWPAPSSPDGGQSDDAAWVALRWRAEALALAEQTAELEADTAGLEEELAAMTQTVSGRVAEQLRRLAPAGAARRRVAGTLDARLSAADARLPFGPSASARKLQLRPSAPRPRARADDPATRALHARLTMATATLADRMPEGQELDEAIAAFAMAVSGTEPGAAAWWTWAVARATYPTEEQFDRMLVRGELLGPSGLAAWIAEDHVVQLRWRMASTRGLRVERGAVYIDVTHTAGDDLHTGVQRVVREVAERWLQHPEARLFSWDRALTKAAVLTADEAVHFRAWRDRVGRREQSPDREIGVEDALLVPWSATVLIPELSAEPDRTARYRALARAGITSRIGMIGHDTIPLTATDTVTPGMSDSFAGYLGFVKYVDRISCNSATTAESFVGYREMVQSQGLAGPEVTPHLLPAEVPPPDEVAIHATRDLLALDDLPVVLAVGSHEPRKNHVPVLHAAEHLWRAGIPFHLVFIGGSGWRSDRFHHLVDRLREAGRPVQVLRNQPEDVLFAAYRLARFMVFPSLAEGFGLPIVEALLSGTPVITSNYGAMAEVAAGGGAITVDPRDTGAIEAAMRLLLTDDDAFARVRDEARALPWKTWDEYARETWRYLVER